MARTNKRTTRTVLSKSRRSVRAVIFGITLFGLVCVPVIFSTQVHRYYSIPKFTVLLLGAAGLLPLITVVALIESKSQRIVVLKSRFKRTSLLFAYVATIAISTVLGVAPRASLFGSFENRMGLVTYLCFLICAVGLVIGVDGRERRLRITALTLSSTGLIVSTYAIAQFFGYDPFVPPETYTFNSAYGPILRVASSLGHADYLGNFLLYTTPLSAALAMSTRGGIRWLTLVSAAASLCAIAASGTRGAWLGIIVGFAFLVILGLKSQAALLTSIRQRKAIASAGIMLLIAAMATWAIIAANGFQSVSARAKQTFTEGLSGSGRTLLWRDTLSMVPRYAFPGCGPEAFRLAFLPYRSEELSRLAPTTINESSHNSYLDAAVSFGLPGLAAYVALIAATLVCFVRAWHDDQQTRTKLLTAGFLSSFVAVLTHNLFIFDQLTTGLYFFSFVGLAQCCLEVSQRPIDVDEKQGLALPKLSGRFAVIAALALIFSAVAAWYAFSSWSDDAALKQLLKDAQAGEIDSVISRGKELTGGPTLTGDLDLQLASALTMVLAKPQPSPTSEAQVRTSQAARKQALDLAIEHSKCGMRNSLTPATGHLLLGTLALMKGDKDLLRQAAREASRIDPNFYGSHWLASEASLAEGNREQAIREAQVALSLNPSSQEAYSVLERAGGTNREQASVLEILARGRALAQKGKLQKARRYYSRALRRAGGPCFDCHIALADVYEQTGQVNEALAELRRAISDDPVNPESDRVRKRIIDLQARAEASVNPPR